MIATYAFSLTTITETGGQRTLASSQMTSDAAIALLKDIRASMSAGGSATAIIFGSTVINTIAYPTLAIHPNPYEIQLEEDRGA